MASEPNARLFLKHQHLLWAYVRGLVRDPHDAEDLFQEVGVCVLGHERPPEDPAEFLRWSRGLAKNVLLHHWRSARRSKVVGAPMLEAVDRAFDEAQEDAAVWSERRDALVACIENLPENSRALIAGHYGAGRTLEQLAATEGRSKEAVKMTLLRIRKGLRACVQSRIGASLHHRAHGDHGELLH